LPASDNGIRWHRFAQGSVVVSSGDLRFTRRLRILSSQDFQAVFRGTQCKSIDKMFTLLARRNGLDHARLGLAIGKRVINTAVGRNRIKRLVRESFRHHQQLLSGLDIVVLSRDGSKRGSNQEIAESLQTHWRRVAERCVKS
jgi:ribonuclease P protein component